MALLSQAFFRNSARFVFALRGITSALQSLVVTTCLSHEAAVQLAAAREFELGSGSAEVRLAESATCYRWCRIHFVRIGQGEVHHTLSGTVVEITAERVALEQLAHKDRLALLGEASAAFAHEVCHALATASTRLLSLDNELDEGQCGPAIRTSVIYALEQVQRAQRVTERTRTFGSAGQHTLEPVNIKSFLTAFIAHHHSISGRMRLDIQIDCPDDLPCIDADPIGLEQVFSNLCKNTLDKYVEQGIAADYRALRISVQNVQGVVKITCSDQAGGLSKEALDRVFQAFLTTKSVRSGTGLGLYISAKLIHAMGGRILCMNRGAGAEFEIYLPIVAE
eukprot:gene1378-1398_t